MAKTTQTNVDNNINETTVDFEKELKTKEQELEMTNKKLADMELQMKLLQQQMLSMGNISNSKSETDEELVVGCNMYSGGTISSRLGDISYTFKYGQEIPILYSELKECFRSTVNNYRELFKDGVFYFVDKKGYDEFKIHSHLDFSDDILIPKLLDGEIPYLDKIEIGNSKKNFNVYYTVMYKVADIYRKGKLKDWSYESRTKFENYFKKKIDEIVMAIDTMAGYL